MKVKTGLFSRLGGPLLLITSIIFTFIFLEMASRVGAVIKHLDNRYTILTFGFRHTPTAFLDLSLFNNSISEPGFSSRS
jgi:hypothetical protein